DSLPPFSGQGEEQMNIGMLDRRWLRVVAVTAISASLLPIWQASAEGSPVPPGQSSLRATALRVDTLTDPIGLGDRSPSLSWNLTSDEGARASAAYQTAYEIRVASTPDRLQYPDIWDSGKVASTATGNIAYGGTPLRSREAAVWVVRVWDANGNASEWSAPGSWE